MQQDRYCRNCGQELLPEDRFCTNCGRPVHETASVPTPEADVPVPPPPQAGGAGGGDAAAAQTPPQERGSRGSTHPILRGCLIIVALFILMSFVIILALWPIISGGGFGGGGGKVAEKPKQERQAAQQEQHKQVIERGKAARDKEQQPSKHAPLPKGDTLEVYYRTTGGAGYEAYAGADGITRPVYFTGPHYADEHLLYHTDHNPVMTIDVTRMTTSGTVEVTIVHDGKQIAHEVANDSNHNVFITGSLQDLTGQ